MAIIAIALIFLGCMGVTKAAIGSSQHRGLLFKHMANNGHRELEPGDDVSEKVRTVCKYHLYGTGSTQLHVGSNGYVTFPNGVTDFIPKKLCDAPPQASKMIAPLWSDNYPPAPFAIGAHVWYNEEKDDQQLLDTARDVIRDAFDNGCDTAKFEPKCLFIVTWQRQESYCDNFGDFWGPGPGLRKKRSADPKKDDQITPRIHSGPHATNYYQLVWATDDKDSFAIFNFLEINWRNCFGAYARSGFFDYNNDDDIKCAELDDSGTFDVNNLESGTNAGMPGRWIYRTDKALIKDEKCNNFVQ